MAKQPCPLCCQRVFTKGLARTLRTAEKVPKTHDKLPRNESKFLMKGTTRGIRNSESVLRKICVL